MDINLIGEADLDRPAAFAHPIARRIFFLLTVRTVAMGVSRTRRLLRLHLRQRAVIRNHEPRQKHHRHQNGAADGRFAKCSHDSSLYTTSPRSPKNLLPAIGLDGRAARRNLPSACLLSNTPPRSWTNPPKNHPGAEGSAAERGRKPGAARRQRASAGHPTSLRVHCGLTPSSFSRSYCPSRAERATAMSQPVDWSSTVRPITRSHRK